MLVHTFADPRFDEHAARGRLHEEAVERLVERVVGIDLGLDEALPHNFGNRPEDSPRVRSERAGLYERDSYAAAKVSAPVDRLEAQRFGPPFVVTLRVESKSFEYSDAVGDDWPW